MTTTTTNGNYVSTGYLANKYGVSAQTIVNQVTANPDIETITTLGGHRRISEKSYRQFLGFEDTEETTDGLRVLIVARVSTTAQKSSLAQQVADCRKWAETNLEGKLNIETNERIASGLFLEHPKFVELTLGIIERKWDVVIARTSERIARSALCLIRELCKRYGVRLEIIADQEKSFFESLADDIIAYCGSAHAKMNGAKTAKLYGVTVTPETLATLYQLKKQGLSYSQIAEHCKQEGLTGSIGATDEPQPLTETVIRKLITTNLKTLQVTDETETTTSVAQFLKKHTRCNPVGEITRQEFDNAYAEFCEKEGLPQLGTMTVTSELKAMGWYDESATKRHSVKGYRIYLGRSLKV
jgi:predicted site-specific integrase-resolvase